MARGPVTESMTWNHVLAAFLYIAHVRASVVNVVVTYPPHHNLVRVAGDTWRQGYRAVVITESKVEGPLPELNTAHESWFGYPDDLRGDADGVWKKGDMKLAAALRIANESLAGNYDWLTYGDDDTFFLMRNVARLVAGIDPNVPLILSDTLNYCSEGRCASTYGRIKVCSLPGADQPTAGACSMRPPRGSREGMHARCALGGGCVRGRECHGWVVRTAVSMRA